MRPLISPELATERLTWIFPQRAFGSIMCGMLAGWAVSSLIYMDAVAPADDAPPIWARPTSLLWWQQNIFDERTSSDDRAAWRKAAAAGKESHEALLREWGLAHEARYRENSRETLRDVLRAFLGHNAVRSRPGLATNSPAPRWALESHFADLFDPSLEGQELSAAIESWNKEHLDAGARLRAHRAREAASGEFAVEVSLPNGKQRTLEYGQSSRILKGIIEEWAPRRLVEPVVLAISEPGDRVYMDDQKVLAALGVQIDAGNLLPDALIADAGTEPVEFWIIEAVFTDGPIHERRKAELLEWAERQRIEPESCRFLTAFESRNAGPARKLLKDLAQGTFAWYLDEPRMELSWDAMDDGSQKIVTLEEN